MTLAALLLAAVLSDGQPSVILEPVASGLSAPVAVAHAGDSRLFIVEQAGIIRIWEPPTTVRAQPFLDIRNLVLDGGERGLLGLAFHPHYAENGFFFVDYTDINGDTVIARYTRNANDPNLADKSSARVLLRIDQPFANHNGGQLQFGPDGYLYIGMGDGGSGGDPDNRAQNRRDLLGKLLRIDVDGNPYAIPPTNPFTGQTDTRPEIWALGLRNPWRFSFDRFTGDLWIADVGQGRREEIDFQPASSTGGENYGWRLMEGSRCFNPSSNCNPGNLVLPVIEYDHDFGCSVTGGYVYRGTRSPRLSGMYIYGDYCSQMIWGARRNSAGTLESQLLLTSPGPISTFGEDVNGEVYVADHAGGQLYRIVDTGSPLPKRRAVRH